MYRKYETGDRKEITIQYVKLQKAHYGLMRASLLFYRKLSKELEDCGFEINPNESCAANKTNKDGKQMTVLWHVDYIMASSKDDFDLTKFSCYLAKIYGPKLMMHTGNKHDYLGVDMEFKEDGTLDISMFAYLRNAIKELRHTVNLEEP